jgi:hypothetical protein
MNYPLLCLSVNTLGAIGRRAGSVDWRRSMPRWMVIWRMAVKAGPRRVLLWPTQRSVSGFFLILVANSTSRLIASARDGRSLWALRQSSTMRKNCSDTRI